MRVPKGTIDENKLANVSKGAINTLIGVPSWQGGIEPPTQVALDKMLYHNLTVGNTVSIKKVYGSVVAKNRNVLAECAMEIGAKYIFFVDTDMIFPPDIIQRLQARDADIVGALYFAKHYPFVPIASLNRGIEGWQSRVDWDRNEYFEVDGIGGGMLLVKTEVFRNIEPPWFSDMPVKVLYTWQVLEDLFKDKPNDEQILKKARKMWKDVKHKDSLVGEDYFFSNLAKRAGYKIWVDGTMDISHIGKCQFGQEDALAARHEMMKTKKPKPKIIVPHQIVC